MASGGYPGKYEKGFKISGIESAEKEDAIVFHAGTSFCGKDIVNSGGRALGVTALGDDIGKAVLKAYDSVSKIKWNGVYYRHDIAHRAIKKQE
jgi:phosphoribosylamine--glycine ligase